MRRKCWNVVLLWAFVSKHRYCFAGKDKQQSKLSKRASSSLSGMLDASTPPPAASDGNNMLPRPSAVPTMYGFKDHSISSSSNFSPSLAPTRRRPAITPNFPAIDHILSSPTTSVQSSTEDVLRIPLSPPTQTPMPKTSSSTLPPVLTSPILFPESRRFIPLPDMSFSVSTSLEPLAVADVNRSVESFLSNFVATATKDDDDDNSFYSIKLETTMLRSNETTSFVVVKSFVVTVKSTTAEHGQDSVLSSQETSAASSLENSDSAALLADYIRENGHELESSLLKLGAVVDRSSWILQNLDENGVPGSVGPTVLVVPEDDASNSNPEMPTTTSGTKVRGASSLQRPGVVAALAVACVVLCMATAPLAARLSSGASVHSRIGEEE